MASRAGGGELRVFAYDNRCPHAGYGLDLGDDDVCDPSGRWVMCMVHGARFRPHDGACVSGPALGASLTRLEAHLDGDEVVIAAPRRAPGPPERAGEG